MRTKAIDPDIASQKVWETMRLAWCLLAVSLGIAGPAWGQIDRYDPNTGKYVTSDPFAQDAPATPSPYRLNPRTTDPAGRPQPDAGAQISSSDPSAFALQSGSPNAPASAAATQFVPLGDMAMFNGGAVSGDDPLALPDWWPQ